MDPVELAEISKKNPNPIPRPPENRPRGLRLTLNDGNRSQKKERQLELVRSMQDIGMLTLEFSELTDIEDILEVAPSTLHILRINGIIHNGTNERFYTLLSQFTNLELLTLPLVSFLDIGWYLQKNTIVRTLKLTGIPKSTSVEVQVHNEYLLWAFLNETSGPPYMLREGFLQKLRNHKYLETLIFEDIKIPESMHLALAETLKDSSLKQLVIRQELSSTAIAAYNKLTTVKVFHGINSYVLERVD